VLVAPNAVATVCANEDLTGAIRKVVGGGKYVSAAFAQKLATDFAEGGEKPPHNLLSDREFTRSRSMRV